MNDENPTEIIPPVVLESDAEPHEFEEQAPGPSDGTGGQVLLASPAWRRWLLIGGGITTGLLLAGALTVMGLNAYYTDRAPMGVTLRGESVAGRSEPELYAKVRAMADGLAYEVATDDGRNVKGTAQDLGVSVDVDATVRSLIDSKSGVWARLNPWDHRDVPLAGSVDQSKLTGFLSNGLSTGDDMAQPSTVAYDDVKGRYTVVEGRDGRTVDPKPVTDMIEWSFTDPKSGARVTTGYVSEAMPVSVDAATQAADTANRIMGLRLIVSNGADGRLTVPRTVIHDWLTVTPDTANHTIPVDVDGMRMGDWLESTLPQKLDRTMVAERRLVDTDGSVLRTEQKGVDGIRVTGVDQTVTELSDAIHGVRDATVTAQTETDAHTVETRTVDYAGAYGDPHAVVNLSEQKAYAYKGSTLVASFLVSTGKPSTPSDTGSFKVNLKYDTKTMRGGSGADAYVTPNVKWVSFYNGGEGFHAAPWNPQGIASGTPKSHGCINMNPQDAKWMYDFLPEGSRVDVVGSTPTGAVR